MSARTLSSLANKGTAGLDSKETGTGGRGTVSDRAVSGTGTGGTATGAGAGGAVSTTAAGATGREVAAVAVAVGGATGEER